MLETIYIILANRTNKENVKITLKCYNITRVTSYKLPEVMIDEALQLDKKALSDDFLLWCLIIYSLPSIMLL